MYELKKNGNTVEIPIESIPEGARIWTITDGDTTTFSVRRTSPWFDLVCPVQIGDVIYVVEDWLKVPVVEKVLYKSEASQVASPSVHNPDPFDWQPASTCPVPRKMKVVSIDVAKHVVSVSDFDSDKDEQTWNWIIGVE